MAIENLRNKLFLGFRGSNSSITTRNIILYADFFFFYGFDENMRMLRY